MPQSSAQKTIDSQNAAVLAEIEGVLRTMPSRQILRNDTPEAWSWMGRAANAITLWDAASGDRAKTCVKLMQHHNIATANRGHIQLMVLLEQARSNLRFHTIGPVNSAIGQGEVFDYFDEIRKIIELAKTDLLFVDPYMDADFVSRYSPHVQSGVSVRLLARKMLLSLVTAVKLFVQQYGTRIESRSTPKIHDRYIIVDGTSCYQSGASFKDGGRMAPTTITQITDAFPAVHQTYEDFWRNGKPEL
jgi:hypothetical protein